MKEALLYKKRAGKNVRCQTCPHRCLIRPGLRGLCGIRENIKGKLYLLTYGVAVAHTPDPVEKKPLYHFLPKTRTYSVATVGCNFRCQSCQNYGISQASKNTELPRNQIMSLGDKLNPGQIVEAAIGFGCPSISYTYTEPTVYLEYALQIMKRAKGKGLKNIWVTNGFLSKETRGVIKNYLDAANIDLKSFDDKFYRESCGGRVQPVLETCQDLKKNGVWLEITTLVIPKFSDKIENLKQIAHFIAEKLGPETPWHVSQFSPEISWQMHNLQQTPPSKLERAYEIGKREGLMHVYTGNLTRAPTQDTYCPKCKTKNIDRSGFAAHRLDKNGRCYKCGFDLNIIE